MAVAKDYLLRDYLLDSAKSEEEIVSWAKAKSDFAGIARFDYVRTKRLEIDGKKLLVLLAAPPMATQRITIFVYVGGEGEWAGEWALLLLRHTNTSVVTIQAETEAKRVVFRSKAGKTLLILPIENVELRPVQKEQ